MSYRDDSAARDERASQLIDEIARLEKQKLAAAIADAKIDEAKRELAQLSVSLPTTVETRPGIVVHLLVFGATAAATCLGYTLIT